MQQGYIVTEHYQKYWKVTLLWVVVALIMIAAALSTIIIIGNMQNLLFDFFDSISQSMNSIFRTNGATSAIYLFIWVGIFILSCYVMRNFSNEQKKSDHQQRKILAGCVLSVLILAAVFFFMLLIADNYEYDEKPAVFFGFFDGMYFLFFLIAEEVTKSLGALGAIGGYGAIFAYLVVFVLFYMALKLIMTIFVCSDNHRSIKLKILKMNAMPICCCKEALKIFPTLSIYFIPAVFMYSTLYILCLRSYESSVNLLAIILMVFFISFDLTVALYVLFFKIRHKADYIALDKHIYELTMYKKTYIKKSKKQKKRQI